MYNECRHIFTSGKKCQSPALRDQNFCYFHQNTRKRTAPANQPHQPYTAPQDTAHHLPPLEDADAIQLALSDVVLALATNRIDPRRAQILIYGLQVASQNNRHRHAIEAADEAKERARPERSRRIRETHQHEDGTLISPPKQTPDLEEIPEKRPPSLGEILLREAEAMKARREAEEQAQAEARQKATEEASAEQSVGVQLPQTGVEIQATADDTATTACHSLTGRKRRGRVPMHPVSRAYFDPRRTPPLKPKKA